MSIDVIDINLRRGRAEIKAYPLLSTNLALASSIPVKSEGVFRIGSGADMASVFSERRSEYPMVWVVLGDDTVTRPIPAAQAWPVT
jgi:hypothetical protein